MAIEKERRKNMIKAKVIEDFSLSKFNELKNIERANPNKNAEGYLYKNDIFECTKDMAEYLTKTNAKGRAFIEIIEVIPEKNVLQETKRKLASEDAINELEKPVIEKKTTTRKTTRKSIAKK
jgi:ABC-type uncharacterized transport system ATPase subunit